MSPRPEVVAAAAWWASRLGCPEPPDNGIRDEQERESTFFAGMMAVVGGRDWTDEQRDAFRRELETGIETHLVRWTTGIWEGGWDLANPQFGSANRAILNDYGPDPVLSEAGERAGLPKLRGTFDLPIKTVMWINPGIVKVREGFGGESVVIWEAPEEKK